jgi:hypothetical protein
VLHNAGRRERKGVLIHSGKKQRTSNVSFYADRHGVLLTVVGLACFATALVSCGGGTNTVSGGTGAINVTLTDPPSCAFPNGAFDHVCVKWTKKVNIPSFSSA